MAFRAKGTGSSRRARPSGAYPAALASSSTNNNRPVRPSPLSFVPPPTSPLPHDVDELQGLQSPALAPEGQAQILETLQTFPLFKDAPEDFLNRVAKKLRPQVHMPRDEIVFSLSIANARLPREKMLRQCILSFEGPSL
jgi:hypothetical protein